MLLSCGAFAGGFVSTGTIDTEEVATETSSSDDVGAVLKPGGGGPFGVTDCGAVLTVPEREAACFAPSTADCFGGADAAGAAEVGAYCFADGELAAAGLAATDDVGGTVSEASGSATLVRSSKVSMKGRTFPCGL